MHSNNKSSEEAAAKLDQVRRGKTTRSGVDSKTSSYQVLKNNQVRRGISNQVRPWQNLHASLQIVGEAIDSCALTLCLPAEVLSLLGCPRLCSSHSQSSCSPALRLPSSDAAWGVRLRSVLRPYVRPTFTVGRSCMHCAIRRQSTAWRHWRSRQLTLFVVYLLYKWNYMCKVFFWLLAGFETYVR